MQRRPWEYRTWSVPTQVDTPIKRGFAVWTTPELLQQLTDRSIDESIRARELAILSSDRGALSPHWSTDVSIARHWAQVQADSLARNSLCLAVVLHAAAPAEDQIEHDLETLHSLDVVSWIGEREVPLKIGTSVQVNAVEWYSPTHFYDRHAFFSNGSVSLTIGSRSDLDRIPAADPRGVSLGLP